MCCRFTLKEMQEFVAMQNHEEDILAHVSGGNNPVHILTLKKIHPQVQVQDNFFRLSDMSHICRLKFPLCHESAK